MAAGTGLPAGPGPDALVSPGPDAASAGAGWAVASHIADQAEQAFGSAANLYDAHQNAVDASQVATLHGQIDSQQRVLQQANQYDAGAFNSAAASARSDFIKAAPARYAPQLADYWDRQQTANSTTVAVNGMARDHALAGQGMTTRLSQLQDSISSTLASGAPLATAEQAPTYQSNWQEAQGLVQSLVDGKYFSPEDGQARLAEIGATAKAAAFQTHVLQVKQTQGTSAAIGEIERLIQGGQPGAAPPADGAFEAGADLTPTERALMGSKAQVALAQSTSLDQAQVNAAQAAKLATQRAVDQQMQTEQHYMLMNGKPSGQGPSDAAIAAAYGWDKVTDYTKGKATALQQNRDDSITPDMTSDQIAQQEASKAALKPLDITLDTPEKIAGLNATIEHLEGGVRNGVPLTSDQGALGKYQLLPGTAAAIAQAHGITSFTSLTPAQQRAELLNPDQKTNTTLGQLAISDLVAKYGSAPKVLFAYHNGFGYSGGQVSSGPVEKAVAAYGEPDADTPVAQWVQKVGAGSATIGAAPKGAQYVQDGADYLATGQKLAAAQAAVTRAGQINTAAVGDPVGFGSTHGWGQPAPLALNGFAGGPADVQGFIASLRTREAQSAATTALHPAMPARTLSNAEAASLSAGVAANPALGPKLAAAATSALGGEGAIQFMREVGLNDAQANGGVLLGMLSADGPVGARVAQTAVAGMQARAAGAKDAPLPHGVTWDKVSQSVAPAFKHIPQELAGRVQIAQNLHLADAQSGAPDDAASYMRAAMGGYKDPQGNAYGGVAPVNGQLTVHPNWMRVGAMPTALRAIGDNGLTGSDAPVFGNGQPMRGKDLAGLQPEILPNGQYALRSPRTNQLATTRTGAPYMLDLDSAQGWLAQHTPGVVGTAAR